MRRHVVKVVAPSPQLGLGLDGDPAPAPRTITPPALVPVAKPAASSALSLARTLDYYRDEHMVASGATEDRLRRFGYTRKILERVLGADTNIETFERNTGREYHKARKAEGKKDGTSKRELTFLIAACNHARREKRTKHEFKIWVPEPSPSRIRVLTEEEEARLMALEKPRRLQLFLYLAFATGARSRAIEELTWDRINFEKRTLDYRVPGVRYRNKRRVVAPISKSLLAVLREAYESRTDDYVIGLGPKGAISSTYHKLKDCYRAIGIDETGVCRHVARHTVATRLLARGESIYKVAKLLGDQVSMIEKTYGHVEAEHMLDVVDGGAA